jgi:endoglucanase
VIVLSRIIDGITDFSLGTSAAAKPASTSAAAVVAAASGKTQYAGVNIAGFDFGCDTSGTCSNNGFVDPGTSGIAQMKHFASDDKLNIFRLPFGWQYMVKNTLGGQAGPGLPRHRRNLHP